ncbi:ATP-grasp domain-containing protein [Agromyces bauzanensis]
MRVAVLRCHRLPRFVTWEIPDVDALFTDDRLLVAAFEAIGADAESVVWADPEVDWDDFDVAIIRSTWDYVDETAAFLDRLEHIEASSCALFNSAAVARWNADKGYLLDLERWGVPIVPTLRASAATRADVLETVARSSWQELVLKPVIGAGAMDVRRLPAGALPAVLDTLVPGGELLVQPLAEAVLSDGEWSVIFIDGRRSHVLRKTPAPGDFRAHGIYGGSVVPGRLAGADLTDVDDMLARIPFDLLYARLDLVRIDGRLAVLELEVIEPMLYFDRASGAVDRLARAALARIGAP